MWEWQFIFKKLESKSGLPSTKARKSGRKFKSLHWEKLREVPGFWRDVPGRKFTRATVYSATRLHIGATRLYRPPDRPTGRPDRPPTVISARHADCIECRAASEDPWCYSGSTQGFSSILKVFLTHFAVLFKATSRLQGKTVDWLFIDCSKPILQELFILAEVLTISPESCIHKGPLIVLTR